MTAIETATRDRVELMGVPIDPVSESETIAAALGGQGGWICPANLDVLRQVVGDPALRRMVEQADLVVPDGMPLIWASRLQRTPLPERVAGSALVCELPPAAAAAGASIFLLGGAPGVADAAAARLRERSPDLRIAGTLCPPYGFERSPAQLERIEAAVLAARPDIVFVALGFPRQERLIMRLRPLMPEAWFVSCGISFSFVTGDVARAPRWMQRAGLEWLHRLAQEPRRLARRYLVEGIPFLVRLLASAAWRRVAR